MSAKLPVLSYTVSPPGVQDVKLTTFSVPQVQTESEKTATPSISSSLPKSECPSSGCSLPSSSSSEIVVRTTVPTIPSNAYCPIPSKSNCTSSGYSVDPTHLQEVYSQILTPITHSDLEASFAPNYTNYIPQ